MLWIANWIMDLFVRAAAGARTFDSQPLSLFSAEFDFLSYDLAVRFRIPVSNHGLRVVVVVFVANFCRLSTLKDFCCPK